MTNVVTIDGPAGAGKSTLARTLSNRLGYTYLESGALYRAVGLAAIEGKVSSENERVAGELVRGLDIEIKPSEQGLRVFLSGREVTDELRNERVGNKASAISKLGPVREAMTDLQRRLGEKGRVVVEGRDAGTVVFPKAKHKYYVDATPVERARRRVAQLAEKGVKADLERVMAEMVERDERDSSRLLAPLKPAEDAIVIDTTGHRPEEIVDRMFRDIVSVDFED